ncbi:hypothetical protein JVT61DRAFT_6886 [Boletus reticuloceps]|uniref:Xylosidase/arabinosidase n=1 Tax=Boletus reticuloceps TaxID=495285 RepID=A0A8I2YJX9_9AGAM|nr:hypothetical protein JVT61DRAFT_6886 [Boletus reticuloceps]
MALRQAGTPKRADPNTIQDKVLVGYQGWFTCAGDGEPIGPGHHGWLHWFNSPIPSGGRPNVDLWPDTSDYDPSELHVAPGLTTSTGDPVHLFSSRNPKTVQRHFHWMALHGVDGAFLQRFAGQCEIKPGNLGVRNLRDEIGDRVREAAEAQGRVFAIMYDVSGVAPDKIQNILEQDWAHLLREKHILDSPNYLHEKNRPVVALWGFGLNGRNHTPELVRAVAGFFRSFTPGGVYLVAGIPGHWRTSTSDADRNPEFVQVWTECFDAISPWTVGRYGNEVEADQWGQGRLKADADYLNRLAADGGPKVDYIPVVLPGGSGFNLSEGKWRMNDMRRNGGRFLWRQLYNARRAGVRTIYGAMWDEYDEGTVYMPVVSYASQLPVHSSFRFLALDVDGHDLPSDWYMRILGYAAEAFHGERTLLDTFPVKELQDYWTTRPHHEDKGDDKQADVEAVTRAFKEWEVSQRHAGAITDTPPPYSLEDTPARHPSTRTIAGDGPTRPPPVRQDMRPSSGHPYSVLAGVGAVAAPLAVGFAAHALSAGRTPSSASSPPPVKMASRPPPPTGQPSYPIPLGPPPPVSGRPFSPPVPVRHPSHDISMHNAHAQGRVPSIGHGGMGFPAPPGALPPMGFKDERRRGRSRSRSRSKSRSHSRSLLAPRMTALARTDTDTISSTSSTSTTTRIVYRLSGHRMG